MSDTTIKKVSAAHSPGGEMGQKYLASGKKVAMRIWQDEPPGRDYPQPERDYETVGYVIDGRAEFYLDGQKVWLEPGDSWVVPPGASHSYRILEPFTAIEATAPPARIRGRDEKESSGKCNTSNERSVLHHDTRSRKANEAHR